MGSWGRPHLNDLLCHMNSVRFVSKESRCRCSLSGTYDDSKMSDIVCSGVSSEDDRVSMMLKDC